jgi:hypothetical protein
MSSTPLSSSSRSARYPRQLISETRSNDTETRTMSHQPVLRRASPRSPLLSSMAPTSSPRSPAPRVCSARRRASRPGAGASTSTPTSECRSLGCQHPRRSASTICAASPTTPAGGTHRWRARRLLVWLALYIRVAAPINRELTKAAVAHDSTHTRTSDAAAMGQHHRICGSPADHRTRTARQRARSDMTYARRQQRCGRADRALTSGTTASPKGPEHAHRHTTRPPY